MAEKLKVTLVKSPIGAIPKHRKTVEALGLRKLNKTVGGQRNDLACQAFGESRRNLIPEGGAQNGVIKLKTR